jgi:hypothetical protein
MWPLPPDGPLSFVCEWPVAGVELTRTEIDAALIIAAASRAQVILSRAADSGPQAAGRGSQPTSSATQSRSIGEERPQGN